MCLLQIVTLLGLRLVATKGFGKFGFFLTLQSLYFNFNFNSKLFLCSFAIFEINQCSVKSLKEMKE